VVRASLPAQEHGSGWPFHVFVVPLPRNPVGALPHRLKNKSELVSSLQPRLPINEVGKYVMGSVVARAALPALVWPGVATPLQGFKHRWFSCAFLGTGHRERFLVLCLPMALWPRVVREMGCLSLIFWEAIMRCRCMSGEALGVRQRRRD